MYNKTMKKISVLLVLALFSGCLLQLPCEAGFFANQKAKLEQKKVYKSTYNDIENVIKTQMVFANKHDLENFISLYSKDFVNSDGFNFEVYKKMVKETWQTYPDIYYESEIKNIEFSDNYATVFVKETAIATPVEQIEDFKTVGELYSISKCVYHLEKHGAKWLINSEKIIEETSTLKYGKARLIDIELNAPKQIGSGKYYTSTLKMDLPEDTYAVASISKEKIIYPQNKAEDAFRNMNNDNILERVFLSNNENVNEYTIASIALSQVENISNDQVQLSLSGLAFIMTRVNVVPENKFIKEENDGKGK